MASNVVELNRRFMTVQDLIDMGRRPMEHACCASCLFCDGPDEFFSACLLIPPVFTGERQNHSGKAIFEYPEVNRSDFCAKWQGEPCDL